MFDADVTIVVSLVSLAMFCVLLATLDFFRGVEVHWVVSLSGFFNRNLCGAVGLLIHSSTCSVILFQNNSKDHFFSRL